MAVQKNKGVPKAKTKLIFQGEGKEFGIKAAHKQQNTGNGAQLIRTGGRCHRSPS